MTTAESQAFTEPRAKLGAVPSPYVTGTDQPDAPRQERPRGIEVRVHGIGDHATYSALGRPRYKELVDSRVWIGQVPDLPPHRLRLVNWSRANRKITRHFSWYLAFPFTLLNVAGYMEPGNKTCRVIMRGGIAAASVCLTVAMAAWITVILETFWHAVAFEDDRLTGVVLQATGPGLLILFILYRMVIGRALVDRGGALISLVTIAALVLMIGYLHTKPANRTDGWLHDLLAAGDPTNAVDPMTTIAVASTGVAWVVAVCLCTVALWKKRDGAAFAGAALLLVLAAALLHAAGSMLRLFTASLVGFIPVSAERLEHILPGTSNRNVLLPKPDDLDSEVVANVGVALRIDLIPVFFVGMLLLCAVVFWFELWRQARQNKPVAGAGGTKPATRVHELVTSLPKELPSAVMLAVVGTAVLWGLMYLGFTMATPWQIANVLLVLQIAGAVAIVLILVRRPEQLADQLRKTFGSIADIAGFWAPDLHPLAGASYRRALLSGIRQTVNDLAMDYPDHPIALVGHSQGSVVCAWFMRGGHWTERPSEATTDRQALQNGLHSVDFRRSDRIALFTCGSPLETLYRTFFPRYFDREFFARTTTMTFGSASWRNYWRKTDPIGSPLPLRRKSDNVDVTEKANEETVGHGEYWREDRLRETIRDFFGTAEIKQRVPLAAFESFRY
ncbi:hypothetical protein BH10ACT9_BH10ACT9_07980 [soil metagenome]